MDGGGGSGSDGGGCSGLPEVTTSSLNYAAFSIAKPPLALREVVRRIPCLDATLEEGDVLYLPALWWHEVRGILSIYLPRCVASLL